MRNNLHAKTKEDERFGGGIIFARQQMKATYTDGTEMMRLSIGREGRAGAFNVGAI